MRPRAFLGAAVVFTAGAQLGCGGIYYAVTATAAQTRLEEARQRGAETRAPYEFQAAKMHLDQAAVEASEASYSDAADDAELAETYAVKAIELVKAAPASGLEPPGALRSDPEGKGK